MSRHVKLSCEAGVDPFGAGADRTYFLNNNFCKQLLLEIVFTKIVQV